MAVPEGRNPRPVTVTVRQRARGLAGVGRASRGVPVRPLAGGDLEVDERLGERARARARRDLRDGACGQGDRPTEVVGGDGEAGGRDVDAGQRGDDDVRRGGEGLELVGVVHRGAVAAERGGDGAGAVARDGQLRVGDPRTGHARVERRGERPGPLDGRGAGIHVDRPDATGDLGDVPRAQAVAGGEGGAVRVGAQAREGRGGVAAVRLLLQDPRVAVALLPVRRGDAVGGGIRGDDPRRQQVDGSGGERGGVRLGVQAPAEHGVVDGGPGGVRRGGDEGPAEGEGCGGEARGGDADEPASVRGGFHGRSLLRPPTGPAGAPRVRPVGRWKAG